MLNFQSHLPAPSAAALQQSAHLSQLLKQSIREKKSIPFTDYMHACLYTPQLGYYMQNKKHLGAEGDFTTAPLISPAFSHCIARYLSTFFQKGLPLQILEFGAGSGQMGLDLLLFLRETYDITVENYFILEPSSCLQAQQRSLLETQLADYPGNIQWVHAIPTAYSGVILANEVLDAMPVHLFRYTQTEGLLEASVSLNEAENFCLHYENRLPIQAQNYLKPLLAHLPDGYTSEINLAAVAWLNTLFQQTKNIFCLLIDYGYPASLYYHPTRTAGTIRCYYQHHLHNNYFLYPGLQDITADLDFSLLSAEAKKIGFSQLALKRQNDFLIEQGILSQTYADPIQQYQHAQTLKQLLLPTEMGERCKVLALEKSA